jgi:hypothetical protein
MAWISIGVWFQIPSITKHQINPNQSKPHEQMEGELTIEMKAKLKVLASATGMFDILNGANPLWLQ